MPPPSPVLFVHVMKTGGSTLFRHLSAHFADDEVFPSRALDIEPDGRARLDVSRYLDHLSMPYLAALPEARRRRIRVYVGHFPYVAREVLGGDLVTMTLLRDPVERTISLLRQRKREIPWANDPNRPARPTTATLEELYARPFVFQLLIRNHQTKIFSLRQSDAPETYLDDIHVDEERLALAKENLAAVDLVGLTERYDEFLDEVEARFGWTVEREARTNVTPVEDRHPVSEALRQRITEDNAIDIAFYEYAKELVELRRARGLLG
jgi:hypothetical protein